MIKIVLMLLACFALAAPVSATTVVDGWEDRVKTVDVGKITDESRPKGGGISPDWDVLQRQIASDLPSVSAIEKEISLATEITGPMIDPTDRNNIEQAGGLASALANHNA